MHEYLETTSQNVSMKIRNNYTKNQNQDWTYFYYVSYKRNCVYRLSTFINVTVLYTIKSRDFIVQVALTLCNLDFFRDLTQNEIRTM